MGWLGKSACKGFSKSLIVLAIWGRKGEPSPGLSEGGEGLVE